MARDNFSTCDELFSKCSSPSEYCSVSRPKLDGFRIACGVHSPPAQTSLLCQFHASIKQQYMVFILISTV